MTHESSLVAGLIRTVEQMARANGARRVTAVHVQLGALAPIAPEHLREHLQQAARGTVLEGCTVEVEVLDDPADDRAQDVIVDSVELESDIAENGGTT